MAHNLAKMALYIKGEFCWIEEGLQQINQLIVKDKVCNDLNS